MFPITCKNRFIYTIRGDVRWAADKLRERIAQDLEKEGARNVIVDGERIQFDGRIWTLDLVKWHFFHMISSGTVTIDCRDKHIGVLFRISFMDYFLIFLLMMGWVVIVVFVLVKPPLPQGLGMFLAAFCWFGLFIGGNVAINYYRFNRFIKNRLHKFFSSVAYLGIHGELITSRRFDDSLPIR